MKLFKKKENLKNTINEIETKLEAAKSNREIYLKSIQIETEDYIKRVSSGDNNLYYYTVSIVSLWNMVKRLSEQIEELEDILTKLTRA